MCFGFLKFGSELTSKHIVSGCSCAAFLLPASVVVILVLCILIEFRGSTSICSDVFVACNFSYGHKWGMTIGILLALGLVGVDVFICSLRRLPLLCSLALSYLFSLWVHVCRV